MNRRAEVHFSGQRAGELTEEDSVYIFRYDRQYLDRQAAMAVSLSLPLREEPFEDKRLFPFFDGLIPEGWMLEIAEQTWKLDPHDRMGLLLACCRDCIGAVSIVPLQEEHEEST
jgi:serine/threonine-protein kinase HipA